MLVLHANWSNGALRLWGEHSIGWPPRAAPVADADAVPSHPFAASAGEIGADLAPAVDPTTDPTIDPDIAPPVASPSEFPEGSLTLRLPMRQGAPAPSPQLARALGLSAELSQGQHASATFTAPCVAIPAADAGRILEALEDRDEHVSSSVRFYAAASRLVDHLMAQQRLIPSLRQDPSGGLRGLWQPWLSDKATADRVATLLAAMPPIARAAADAFEHQPWSVLWDFLVNVADARVRQALGRDALHEAVEGRSDTDPHVAWLRGLLSVDIDAVPAGAATRGEIVKRVYRWISGLEDRPTGPAWRLCLKLSEPLNLGELSDLAAPGDKIQWTLSFHLQPASGAPLFVDAEDLWLLPPGAATIAGQTIQAPQQTLLAELGRAARLYKKLEEALRLNQPTQIELVTSEAYNFLREVRPILIEQGVGVIVPEWWETPTVRLGARLQVESDPIDAVEPGHENVAPTRASGPALGLKSLVRYHWQLAIGNTNLTLEQFQKLAAQHSPLVRLGGRWVEVRPDDVRTAMDFLTKNPGGEADIAGILRLAFASDARTTGLPIIGMDATGWVASVFGDPASNHAMPMLTTPAGFIGALRPYQVRGLSWLAFLDRFGLGACLADDMGLGKTIQLLALLAQERTAAESIRASGGDAERPGPTLLVVPMSVVGNWRHETARFTPQLKVLIHHGPERLLGPGFIKAATDSDLIVTTYALAHRDAELLGVVPWHRIVLDEAQNIKNPAAKQSQAVRSIPAPRRVALTGTPVENRLSELWSIMDFLNPGYLGTPTDFRNRFAVPIERYHDSHKAERLRGLIRPFILRRLKSDPTVIADLPAKLETKEYCYLTPEQASLYRACVSDMLTAADKTEGMQRRGVVLAGLIKLKQICNHPAQFFKEAAGGGEGEDGLPIAPHQIARSGKCLRIVEMLSEVLAGGDQALVFTQFRQMGHILSAMLRHELDREVLFLHGGTTAQQREALVARFQKADGSAPIFILSLKAGGLGLNLTAATHVFHFDRWWNPAVEAQATDRAYRIGQTRTVQVHKFVVSGTLEERIDQMIESKTELADHIIGAGERWLTELSTSQLRELLTLRADAVGEVGGEVAETAGAV